jgi:putative glycosyltransferase (TIGR04372 family)
LRWALRAPAVQFAALMAIARLESDDQRWAVRKLLALNSAEINRDLAQVANHCVRWLKRKKFVDIHRLILAHDPALIESWADFAGPVPLGEMDDADRLYATAIAAYELGRYRDAVDAFCRIKSMSLVELRDNYDYLKAAYSAGKLRKTDLAIEFFARQFLPVFDFDQQFGASESALFRDHVFQRVFAALTPSLTPQSDQNKSASRIGLFFLSSVDALGHAILDPYHFLALHRDRYDRIFFIGPPRSSYRAASAVCLEIVAQYGEYVETHDQLLLNLSWMTLGTWQIGPLTIQFDRFHGRTPRGQSWQVSGERPIDSLEAVIEHYWSLLREVVHRSRASGDTFRHNSWHMTLPSGFVSRGEAFCRQRHVDLNRPLVVVHARDHDYHKIAKQSFRNTSISTYLPALSHLLDLGYQVLRVGDRNMTRLTLDHPNYHELPFMEGYQHALDPFFVSRARFMIGCQSGPCAYARALGVPILSVNAVLHYTLLPSTMEIACFKHYIRDDVEPSFELDVVEALAARSYHFDNAYQYREARIRVEEAEAEEILAAVKDMLAWLEKPDLPETDLQIAFRKAVERTANTLMSDGIALDLPIGDFLGIVLPGYRISPSVAAMRGRAQPRLSAAPAA